MFTALERPGLAFEVAIHRTAADGVVVLNERTDVLAFGPVRLQFWVCGVFEVHDGRITLWRDYFDQFDFAKAVVRGLVGAVIPALRPRCEQDQTRLLPRWSSATRCGKRLPDSMLDWVRNDLAGPGATRRLMLRVLIPAVLILAPFWLIPTPLYVHLTHDGARSSIPFVSLLARAEQDLAPAHAAGARPGPVAGRRAGPSARRRQASSPISIGSGPARSSAELGTHGI